jgi:hypothetical protein
MSKAVLTFAMAFGLALPNLALADQKNRRRSQRRNKVIYPRRASVSLTRVLNGVTKKDRLVAAQDQPNHRSPLKGTSTDSRG